MFPIYLTSTKEQRSLALSSNETTLRPGGEEETKKLRVVKTCVTNCEQPTRVDFGLSSPSLQQPFEIVFDLEYVRNRRLGIQISASFEPEKVSFRMESISFTIQVNNLIVLRTQDLEGRLFLLTGDRRLAFHMPVQVCLLSRKSRVSIWLTRVSWQVLVIWKAYSDCVLLVNELDTKLPRNRAVFKVSCNDVHSHE
jgi:hypothetical protein